uniref:SPRY domain-containing protein n=1 Tax=Ascaris lumbricoides TaxID=6252 RepID=A0A0M3HKG0_ASCLU
MAQVLLATIRSDKWSFQFESLQNGGHYVAVSQGPFIPIKYGTAIVEGDKEKVCLGKGFFIYS